MPTSSYAQMMGNYSRPRSPAPSSTAATTPRNTNQQYQQHQHPSPTRGTQKPMVYSFEQSYSHNSNNRSSPPRVSAATTSGGSMLPDTPPPVPTAEQLQQQQLQSGYYQMPHLKSASPSRGSEATNFGTSTTNVVHAPPPSSYSDYINNHASSSSTAMPTTPTGNTVYQQRRNNMSMNAPLSPAPSQNNNNINQRSGLVMSPATGTNARQQQNTHSTTNNYSDTASREASLERQRQPISSLPAPAVHPTFVANNNHPNNNSDSRNTAALDSVLAESMSHKRAAENAYHDLKKLEATHRETTRTLEEKLRTSHSAASSLENENSSLRRQILDQQDTIHRLRDQSSNLGRARSAAEKLRGENTIYKDKMKELEHKVTELETAKATLYRRLEEKEKTAVSRHGDVNVLRTKLHNKEETVATLSESLSVRESELAKLKVEYQHVASQIGQEKQDRMTEIAKFENIIADSKEREMNSRSRIHELENEIESLRRSRDEWWQEAETQKMRAIQQAKQAIRVVIDLEEKSRSFNEVYFSYMTEDHCSRMQEIMWQSGLERSTSRKTMAKLLDDTDELVKELDFANDTARTESDEKQVLGSEVRDVNDMCLDMMRGLELMTSSASWRRAMLETLIPDEISNQVNRVRKACAEVVHRTGIISKRALTPKN